MKLILFDAIRLVGMALFLIVSPIDLSAQQPKQSRKVPRLKFPGKSHRGPLPKLTANEKKLASSLRRDVDVLARDIGERNVKQYDKLVKAAKHLEKTLTASGYKVRRQTYHVDGKSCWNLIVEQKGTSRPKEIIVVGAHYDSIKGSPGANDNASGVAAVLALAARFSRRKTDRTLRFVAFTNEEPPYFQTEEMGSLVYARRLKQRGENVVAMLSLETIGYYTDKPDTQKYPLPLGLYYPSTGNFIGILGNIESEPLVTKLVTSFRRHAKFPSEGAALPSVMEGIGWSDHWSFWQQGYPAAMVTDSAPFRYPYYHSRKDTPDKIDYQRMARVVAGLEKAIIDLVTISKHRDKPKKSRSPGR